jgi:predicted type IV restriction endonuclease
MAVKAPKPITFNEQLFQLAEKIETTKEQISTEEGTKNSFIMPFIQILGYDVFNHNEVMPEFIADAGMKKNEKVDYALLKGGKSIILIECKKWKEKLDKHGTQLTRYFTFSVAKFGILTNGIKFWFLQTLIRQILWIIIRFFNLILQTILKPKPNLLNSLARIYMIKKKYLIWQRNMFTVER